jgi:hypothetical protein
MGKLTDLLLGPRSPMYRRWLLISAETGTVLWLRASWRKLASSVIALKGNWAGEADVEVTLLDHSRTGPVAKRRFRLNEESWCLGDDGEALEGVHQARVTIRCPSANVCKRCRSWPSLLVDAVKPFNEYNSMVVHLAASAAVEWQGRDEDLVSVLRRLVRPHFVLRGDARWNGLPKSKAMDAFPLFGLNYRGSHKDRIPNLSLLEGEWREDYSV